MKKILFALVALLFCCGIDANAQNIVKYTCTEAATYTPSEGWSEWFKVTHSVTVNMANHTMVVYGDGKVTYQIIDATGETPTGDGGAIVVMYGVDQFGEYCKITAIVEPDGQKLLRFDYDMVGTLLYKVK
jgi:hypothetical protein